MSLIPIAAIKALVDVLADMEITPLHLHIDGRGALDGRPQMSMWAHTVTDMHAICTALGVTAKEEKAKRREGQRYWSAEHNPKSHQLLIQCVSMAHHDDWEAPQ